MPAGTARRVDVLPLVLGRVDGWPTLPGCRRQRTRGVPSRQFSESTALGDGRDVGTVKGENAFEDITSLGYFIGLGDHQEHVVVAAAG